MTTVFITIAGLTVAYLIGAIPTSILISQQFFGTDIRKHGSNNPGATNTFRVLGVMPGIIVLAIDIIKGVIATSLPFFLNHFGLLDLGAGSLINYMLMFGIFAVLGHIFPIYVNFNGGKGIATLFGMILTILPKIALICAGVFVIVLLASRYVSLGSILGTLTFPILIFFIFNIESIYVRIFSLAILLAVLITHHENIKRLLNNEENKANLFDQDDDS